MSNTEIAVVGTGPAGLSAAIAFAQAGFKVASIGPTTRAHATDTRTAALFSGSMALLDHLGVMADLAPDVEPLKGIRIVDDTGRLLKAPEVVFDAGEIGQADFGSNVPQIPLDRALNAVAVGTTGLTRMAAAVRSVAAGKDHVTVTLDNGDAIDAKLLVAADGRNSLCRKAVGIEVDTWTYPQTAIAAQFSHSRPHRGISTEFHRPEGPCTVVPMPGRRSSLVWVERPETAERLAALDDRAFAAVVEERLQGVLGSLSDMGPRRLFPLACLKAKSLGRDRVALVGDAGHTMPPIGAQGLNLGFRDVATLVDLVSDARADGGDVGDDVVLARYTKARHLDVNVRTTAVDLLNRSLLADMLPADLARGFGLHAIATIGALKRRVMKAGFEPVGALPSLMRA